MAKSNEFPWSKRPSRVGIENVEPEIDGGRFAVKRTTLDKFTVRADIHSDGHDVLAAVILYRKAVSPEWSQAPMFLLGNDRWQGSFAVPHVGRYEYTIEAWVDYFESWRSSFLKKVDAGQDVSLDLLIGAELIEAAAGRAPAPHDDLLRSAAARLRETNAPPEERIGIVVEHEIDRVTRLYPDRSTSAIYQKTLEITVDRQRAQFSSWYEMFPRSCASEPGIHGTFRDCEQKLPYAAQMGFDVLYLPPIHPIGRTNRKGKNNSAQPEPGDVGSPWAIGSEEGGHKSIHPQLGTLDDFRALVSRAREHGMEIALDLAFQCSPDHPWIREHPDWFRRRPDGSIQYAENPPKKYEDIVPLDFETSDWKALYQELLSVVLFWIDQGVSIFRVDNPHTKPYAFWEWMIGQVKSVHPEIIFLSEAFTRPKVMYRLAKLGFTQSYTYFTWRQTAKEIRDYMTELTRPPVSEFFRPNLWPNTPDILPEHLQVGGRPAFQLRLVLAATLASNYGIYGPAFELCDDVPLGPGREEYLNSEKFEIREWNREQASTLRWLIARVNEIRKENKALQSNSNLHFHRVTNDQLLAYSKHSDDRSNLILTIVNLDVNHVQSGYVDLPLSELNVETARPFQVHDLLSGKRYLWSGPRNYVELDPKMMPAHIFRLRRYLRTERDFDYYL
jgi:starch synthase (maltosyl-transferring)